MPGHKLGRGIPEVFLSNIEKLDLTEIPGLDDLHNPSGIVNEAQKLAAEAFGAKKSYFLVNGSTVGIHAAISAVCRPGQCLVAGRDSHSAVICGMLMAGVRPYYIMPEYSDTFGICTGITPREVDRALRDAPDAAGVIITRPNYYGVCCDIWEIAKIVHSRNKILIVDEAHGPHLVFNKRLPVCALEAGADICIQSAHKTLPAFTQGAYLHIGTDRADTERIEYFLDIYQTTSPSYIIMAFLDIAREVMQKQGTQLLDRLLDSLESHIKSFGGRKMILDRAAVPGFDIDTTRLTVNVGRLGMTGYEAERLLRQKYNIQVEMSDASNVVCICTAADSPESIGALFSALERLRRDADRIRAESCCLGDIVPDCMVSMPANSGNSGSGPDPAEIMNAETERVRLENAAGRISKGIIAPYPPGIPLVCPGETITRDIADFLLRLTEAGGRAHGISGDGTVAVIKVR
jgi:lysine decarboxylase